MLKDVEKTVIMKARLVRCPEKRGIPLSRGRASGGQNKYIRTDRIERPVGG